MDKIEDETCGFCKKHGYYENFTESDKCPICEYDKQKEANE